MQSHFSEMNIDTNNNNDNNYNNTRVVIWVRPPSLSLSFLYTIRIQQKKYN